MTTVILITGCQNFGEESIEDNNSSHNIILTNRDSVFLKMIDEEIITNPKEKIYISDITKLKSLKLISCDSMNIHYLDVVNDKSIELKIVLKKFKQKEHEILYHQSNKFGNQIEFIDGSEPWGGIYSHPETEIDNIILIVNNNQIEIQKEFSDIYNLVMCDADYRNYFNPNPLLKYDTENDVFYLYIKGGIAADNYFGKYIFNEKEYLNRYLIHYGQLSETGSFRADFKGFWLYEDELIDIPLIRWVICNNYNYIFFYFILLWSFFSCTTEKSIDEIDSFLENGNFEIEAIYHGGLVGQCKVTYNFIAISDSVDIYALTYCMSPKMIERLRISKSEYDQLLDNIICLSKLHQADGVARGGCSPPWDTEYFINKNFSRLRIFPSLIESCPIEEIIYRHRKSNDLYL